MHGRIAAGVVVLLVLLAGCGTVPPPNEPAAPETTEALGILDTTATRAGTVREVLTELQAEIPDAITGYTECAATTSQYPRPYDLPCHPYSGLNDEQPAYGLLNLLGYVATGEKDALAGASGDCAAALSESHNDTLSGWALQNAIKALNDTFVVGYPGIDAHLATVTDLLNQKSVAVAQALEVC